MANDIRSINSQLSGASREIPETQRARESRPPARPQIIEDRVTISERREDGSQTNSSLGIRQVQEPQSITISTPLAPTAPALGALDSALDGVNKARQETGKTINKISEGIIYVSGEDIILTLQYENGDLDTVLHGLAKKANAKKEAPVVITTPADSKDQTDLNARQAQEATEKPVTDLSEESVPIPRDPTLIG